MKKKCNPQTFVENEELYWVCPNVLGQRVPRKYSTTNKCWKYDCPGIINLDAKICAYHACSKATAPNSKYCSPNCRKKNSRYNRKNATLST